MDSALNHISWTHSQVEKHGEPLFRLINEASDRIQDLLDIGVDFEKDVDGEFHLAKEGGHSSRRILHSKDATGKEIERALTQTAERHVNIELMPNNLAIDLIQCEHGNPKAGITGVWCLDQTTQTVMTVHADTLILATGGFGHITVPDNQSKCSA